MIDPNIKKKLDERLINGEIDIDKYNEILATLQKTNEIDTSKRNK